MMQLRLDKPTNNGLEILCIGAHSDDIEIGCGGTVLRLAERYPGSIFHWVVLTAAGARAAEAQEAARRFTESARLCGPILKEFRDGFLPYVASEVKELFEELKSRISPDIVFTHNRKDAHQDHRLAAELTWNTFRDHMILEYEIPKYDGDLGQPAVFVPLSDEHYRTKVDHLLAAFPSQHAKRWFQPETFLALMRLRGMECNAPSGYAEAFYCRKLVI